MKCLVSTLFLVIPSFCNAAYYLEDEVPAKVTAQLTVVEDKYQTQPTYMYNVPFYVNKYALGPSAVTSLKNLMPEFTKAKKIIIEGRPDANGQNDTDLARRRGLAVKKYLAINGIQESKINVEIKREVKFDVNPSIFNTTVYTSESLPELNKNVKSSLYTEKPATQVEAPQPAKSIVTEIKATSPSVENKSAVTLKSIHAPNQSETPQKISPKVEGSFNVLRKEMEDKSNPTTYDFPVRGKLDIEFNNMISNLLINSKEVLVIADGSIAGYKKAKEISNYIGEMTGSYPEVKPKGANKDFVKIKG
ncbi:MAG: hypothetical protein Q8N30_04150 [Methylococcales bacterium]|nr:hypothetical protein [Methylococcales bacterium]